MYSHILAASLLPERLSAKGKIYLLLLPLGKNPLIPTFLASLLGLILKNPLYSPFVAQLAPAFEDSHPLADFLSFGYHLYPLGHLSASHHSHN